MSTKVLILIDWFLPGNKAGGPVKSIYSLVSELQDKAIDFYIITLNTDINSKKTYENIISDSWTNYKGLKIFYFSKSKFTVSNIIQVTKSISPDVIYINSFWSFKFSILPLFLKKIFLLNIPIIIAPRGMLAEGSLAIKSLKKKLFLLLSKVMKLHKKVIFHVTSLPEQKAVSELYKNSKVFFIDNMTSIKIHKEQVDKPENILKLIFLSRISPVKNLDYALKVLKELPMPNNAKIEMDIYGNNEDTDYWKICKEQIKQMPENIIVKYKGILNFDEVGSTILKYHFLFLPTRNENFGHAIVETLLCGRPVIISNQTPWNSVHDFCGFVCDLQQPSCFQESILKALSMNNEKFVQFCENSTTFINQKLEIEKLRKEYLNMFSYARESRK